MFPSIICKLGNLFKISGYNSFGFLSCGLLFHKVGFSKANGFPLKTTSFNSGKFAKLLISSILLIRLFPIYNFSNLTKLLRPSNFSISLYDIQSSLSDFPKKSNPRIAL